MKSQSSTKIKKDQSINGRTLIKLVEAGLAWLKTNQQLVNSLNVFPVPDGDTGTNMVLTMQAALDEIGETTENNFGKIAHSIAHGALMGARGNSGVILSQLWRGFARSIDNETTLDAKSLIQALIAARDTAYKGVVRPVEGTILTVAKDIAQAAEHALFTTSDIKQILEIIVKEADLSVKRTPDLLPVLKEAGVVDSGGKGLFFIFDGMLRFVHGQSLETPQKSVQPLASMITDISLNGIEPGQEVEVVVDFYPKQELDLNSFYKDLEKIGTSIQVGEGDGLFRLHIHVTNDRKDEPLTYIQSFATWQKATYENLVTQMENMVVQKPETIYALAPVEPDQIAVVAVSPGDGITKVFCSLGAAAIVEGGQTMNPSTQEILGAFENLSTDKIIILPNNKNIIGAAESAAGLSVKKVAVIPTRSIPQGFAAMMRLAPFGDFNEIVREMNDSIDGVLTGEITKATRSVEIDGVEAKQGEFIALLNGKLVSSATKIEKACMDLFSKINLDDYELITLFRGENLEPDDLTKLADLIEQKYEHIEVEVQEGNQPHYHIIISIE